MYAYDTEAGWWYAYDLASGDRVRWLSADEVKLLPVGARQTKEGENYAEEPTLPEGLPPIIPPPETGQEGGPDTVHDIGGDILLTTEDAARLSRWNAQEGVQTITASELQSAKAYMNLGYTFEQSLNLYSKWRAGVPGIYDPWVIAPLDTEEKAQAWRESKMAEREQRREFERMTGAAATPAGAAAGGLSAEALATPVGQAIAAVTDDPVVQAAMWAGAGLEGSQEGPWGTEAGGAHVGGDLEVGPWQIHPIHFENITAEAAADPNSAALYMLPRYEDAVKSVPADLWQTDPEAALALAIANAEKPQGWHEGLTAEEALAIYGGSERVGGAATGAAGGPGLPGLAAGPYVPPGAEPIMPTLTREQEIEAARLAVVHGLPGYVYVAAVAAGVTGEDAIIDFWLSMTDEAALIAYKKANAPLVERLGIEWTDEDWQEAANLGLSEADLTEAAHANQTPRQWYEEGVADVEQMLKDQNLTWEDLDVMREHGMTVPDYVMMAELGMTPEQWDMGMQRLGSAEAVWTAKQIGYDPSTMNPQQMAQFELRTDVNVQIMRAWEDIPEGIKPQVNFGAISGQYALRQAEARTQGRFLSPQEFLGGEYPGLFGGGTASELRGDLERISATGEIQMYDPATRRGGRQPRGGVAGPRVGWRPFGNLTRTGEMIGTRSMAQTFLGQTGPVGTQTQAEYEARQTKVAGRYPELAGRTAAGEFETEKEKRRRRLKEGLQGAGRG